MILALAVLLVLSCTGGGSEQDYEPLIAATPTPAPATPTPTPARGLPDDAVAAFADPVPIDGDFLVAVGPETHGILHVKRVSLSGGVMQSQEVVFEPDEDTHISSVVQGGGSTALLTLCHEGNCGPLAAAELDGTTILVRTRDLGARLGRDCRARWPVRTARAYARGR